MMALRAFTKKCEKRVNEKAKQDHSPNSAKRNLL